MGATVSTDYTEIIRRGLCGLNQSLRPVLIRIEQVTEKNKKDAVKVLSRQECTGGEEIDDNLLMVLVYMGGESVGFLSLDLSNKYCCYINYMCAADTNTRGIGTFLGFLAVFVAKITRKYMVYSFGISTVKTKAKYPRLDNDIVLSQYILIEKLGFIDGYKKDTYDKDKLMSIAAKCNGPPETYLDIV